ncbi:hypothetical protein Nans01_15690 [Nocardiopsis ansamitocini]|uniref:Type II secretion system protein GspF domain-containing protein n=1 Tax=Nocardiopsis ansamitocini TaxID=1670832 RepID=A0A9W6P513_9ACTN|nr:hypothetical protein Nans01_15690 [Nocardiopsis ansamitocini]
MDWPALSALLAPYGPVLLLIGCAGCAAAWSSPSPGELRLQRIDTRLFRWRLPDLRTMLTRRLASSPERLRAARLRASVELCRVMTAELRAGRSPAHALEAGTAEIAPHRAVDLTEAVSLARQGHDPCDALLRAAAEPGAWGLAYLAACWRVAATSGNGLALVVERLAESLTREEALRQELSAQLAGPRATAALLAGLPVLGLLMAGGLGAAPLTFLFTTPAGLACLAGGLCLDAVGLWWTRRMVRGVLSALEP